MKLKWAGLSIAVWATLLAAAWAQPSEITYAEWGNHNHHVDVTDRVRSLVRDGRLRFDVNNDAFGTDPDPHQTKTLILRVRQEGGERELRFAEHSVVDLDVGVGGYRGGSHGGDHDHFDHDRRGGGYGLEILRAEYGAEGHYVDVTNLLQRHVSGDRLSMHINNDTMGTDPAPGTRKELRIEYRLNGDRRDTEVPESSDLRLP